MLGWVDLGNTCWELSRLPYVTVSTVWEPVLLLLLLRGDAVSASALVGSLLNNAEDMLLVNYMGAQQCEI